MKKRFMAKFEVIINAWALVSQYLTVPSNNEELNRLIEFSNYLIDSIGENENVLSDWLA